MCLCFCHLKRLAAAKKRFETLSVKSTPVDAMEDWLSTAVINTSSDAITYWSGMQAAGHELAQMALDYLSIPGTYISQFIFTI